jgi:hypothetical protein
MSRIALGRNRFVASDSQRCEPHTEKGLAVCDSRFRFGAPPAKRYVL